MRIRDLRSKFTIFVFMQEITLTTEIKQAFAASGYETFMFIDQDVLMSRLKDAAPHVILFSPDALISTMSEFVKSILEINSEIQFVCCASGDQAMALEHYREFNFAQIIEPQPLLQVRSLWAVDTICERLALQYQNESMVDQIHQLQDRLTHQESILLQTQGELKGQVEACPQIIPMLQKFGRATTKEEMIESFLDHISLKKGDDKSTGLYLKFLPSVLSLVATQGRRIDLERTKGIGAKLTTNEIASLVDDLKIRTLPSTVESMLKEVFQAQSYTIFPLFLQNQPDGVFVFWGASFNDGDWGEFLLYQLAFQNSYMVKKLELLDQVDPGTDLYNKNFYKKKLDEEISRSRRISKPVSVIKMSLDRSEEIERSAGYLQRDLILKAIASLIKRTTRVNDYACRTGPVEISLVLPHCTKKGAAGRGERLRRAIESHSFSLSGIQVSISIGISEYPSLCSTTEELDLTASQALRFVVEKGGNKVCLFKASESFKPDFEVPAD